MAEDIIDIRKRIEEMRNEVLSALVGGDEVVIPSAPAGEIAEFAVPGVAAATTTRKAEGPAPDRAAMKQTKVAFDDALLLPSFRPNVRDRGMNKALLFLVTCQLVTNACLIAIIWHKLG